MTSMPRKLTKNIALVQGHSGTACASTQFLCDEIWIEDSFVAQQRADGPGYLGR